MNNSDELNARLKQAEDRIHSIPDCFAKEFGMEGGHLLQNIHFWSDRSTNFSIGKNTFYKNKESWSQDELRIKKSCMNKYLKTFIELGFIETRTKKIGGVNRYVVEVFPDVIYKFFDLLKVKNETLKSEKNDFPYTELNKHNSTHTQKSKSDSSEKMTPDSKVAKNLQSKSDYLEKIILGFQVSENFKLKFDQLKIPRDFYLDPDRLDEFKGYAIQKGLHELQLNSHYLNSIKVQRKDYLSYQAQIRRLEKDQSRQSVNESIRNIYDTSWGDDIPTMSPEEFDYHQCNEKTNSINNLAVVASL